MNNNKAGESLVGIVIGIFILSFILIGIISVLSFSKDISLGYENKIEENLIQTNSENIIDNLYDDIDLGEEEFFYIDKDTTNKVFKVLTGSINEDSKYIDRLGNKTNSGSDEKVFTRVYKNEIDVLRHVINPIEIPNLVFHFDASNTGSLSYDGLNRISQWSDLSGNGMHATQSNSSEKPILIDEAIGQYSGVQFDGGDDLLKMDNHELLNNNDDGYANRVFEKKSYSIVFKTGQDITNDQVIYEEGGAATGYNFMIHNGKLYVGIHNIVENCSGSAPCFTSYTDSTYSSSDTNKWYYQWKKNPDLSYNRAHSIELDEVLPSTLYFISIVQDSSHFTNPEAGDGIKTIERNTSDTVLDNIRGPIDSQNRLQIFLNGNLVDEDRGVDPMPEHHLPGLGNINEWTVRPRNSSPTGKDDNLSFEGVIGEFMSWNHALTDEEVRGVNNYFIDKWLGGVESPKHNIIKTNIKQLK